MAVVEGGERSPQEMIQITRVGRACQAGHFQLVFGVAWGEREACVQLTATNTSALFHNPPQAVALRVARCRDRPRRTIAGILSGGSFVT
jgi:hypothetical protein